MILSKIKMNITSTQDQTNEADICIADSGATHTILKSKRYFYELKPTKGIVNTISGPADLIEGVEKANLALPNGTKLIIENVCFPQNQRETC